MCVYVWSCVCVYMCICIFMYVKVCLLFLPYSSYSKYNTSHPVFSFIYLRVGAVFIFLFAVLYYTFCAVVYLPAYCITQK